MICPWYSDVILYKSSGHYYHVYFTFQYEDGKFDQALRDFKHFLVGYCAAGAVRASITVFGRGRLDPQLEVIMVDVDLHNKHDCIISHKDTELIPPYLDWLHERGKYKYEKENCHEPT